MIEKAVKQRVIVGLGNPGRKYELTRHNLGYMVVQGIAQLKGWDFKEQKSLHALTVKGHEGDVMMHLVLPTTYMNESGRAVRQYLDYYKLPKEALVVVVDDIALPFGEMRLRRSGSAGGHNGLKSIALHLGTNDFVRLRMGIGLEQQNGSLVDYVLDTFTQQELGRLPDILRKGITVVQRLMHEALSHVMNDVNKKLTKKQPSRPHVEGQEKKE